jgi:AcrR family transcriptional regulator
VASQKPRVLTKEERRQRNHDEMIANILQAARQVMRERGVADLNLQDIVRKMGMRAPSLYYYFPNKVAIYDALFVMGMRQYREMMEQQLRDYGANWQGLQKIMEGYFSFAQENPELYQLLFERPVPDFVPSEEGLAESARLLDVARRSIGEAITSGAIRSPFSIDATMNLIIALMHGFTAQHLANEPELPLGSGRFGSLIPVIMEILQQAWSQDRTSEQ